MLKSISTQTDKGKDKLLELAVGTFFLFVCLPNVILLSSSAVGLGIQSCLCTRHYAKHLALEYLCYVETVTHFADEALEARRGEKACLSSHSREPHGRSRIGSHICPTPKPSCFSIQNSWCVLCQRTWPLFFKDLAKDCIQRDLRIYV